MSAGRALVMLTLAAGGAWALYQLEQERLAREAAAAAAAQPQGRRGGNLGTIGAILGVVGELIGSNGGQGSSTGPIADVLGGIGAGGGGGAAGGATGPLLDAIAKGEAGAAGYNAIWNGIAAIDRPSKPLTQMTVGQVLAWQDSIDARYMSEAAGRYQFLEDTLRGLSPPLSALFNARTQDMLAEKLLVRRGLNSYRSGAISAEKFAANLAMEWASIGVPYDMQGASRRVKRGQSYYAGDGLNAAHTSPDTILAAIRRL